MKYRSGISEAIYEEVLAEFEAGLISEAELREYDELCLVQEAEPTYEATPVLTEHAVAAL